LCIPGEFFIEDEFPQDPQPFLEKFRIFMRKIKSQPVAHHYKKTPFYHKDLFTCSHVWIRQDSIKKALQPPYSGPFRVVNRISNNLFTIDIAGKLTNISTDRLKPAFLPKDTIIPSTSSIPSSLNEDRPIKTYSGLKKKVHNVIKTLLRGE